MASVELQNRWPMSSLPAEETSLRPTGSTQPARDAGSGTFQSSRQDDGSENMRFESSLGQVDGGFQAWSLVCLTPSFASCAIKHFCFICAQLVAAFLVEVLIWGFPNSYGTLLAAYLQDPTYSSQKQADMLLPLIGTLCTGIMYFSCKQSSQVWYNSGSHADYTHGLALIIYPTMRWYPRVRRIYTWSGLVMCSVGLLAASFTTKVLYDFQVPGDSMTEVSCQITSMIALQGVLFAIGGCEYLLSVLHDCQTNHFNSLSIRTDPFVHIGMVCRKTRSS